MSETLLKMSVPWAVVHWRHGPSSGGKVGTGTPRATTAVTLTYWDCVHQVVTNHQGSAIAGKAL